MGSVGTWGGIGATSNLKDEGGGGASVNLVGTLIFGHVHANAMGPMSVCLPRNTQSGTHLSILIPVWVEKGRAVLTDRVNMSVMGIMTAITISL